MGADQEASVAAMRRFNRFYTRRIGVLAEAPLGSGFTLAEMRVLYELANGANPSAARIGADLGLDAGYLSRIVKRFVSEGLVSRAPDLGDARSHILTLTAAGREAFAPLDERSQEAMGALLAPLSSADRRKVVLAMDAITQTLGETALPASAGPVVGLREHAPGDLGWIVSRHGALYARDYGWDTTFEAAVAEIAAAFLTHYDPARERAFIADRDGQRLGSALVVRADDETAKLRLVLVEPAARGLGLGRRLVSACTDFARERGYRRIVLWTNDCLTAARAIYAREGYRLTASAPHRSYGVDLVGETWELTL